MEARVWVSMDSPAEVGIVKRAMSVDKKPGDRSSMTASAEGDELVLNIQASDLGALRAALNSSLRQVKIASDSLIS